MAASESFVGSVRRLFRDYVATMGTKGSFGKLMTQAVHDAALRRRLVQSPKTVLAEAGVTLPPGLNVEILENSEKVIHLVLPPLVDAGKAKGTGR